MEIEMPEHRNILIIGNGFDIYHGLPTKYSDFLEFIKQWKNFYDWFRKNLNNYYDGDPKNLTIRLNNGSISLDSIVDFSKYASVYNLKEINYINDNFENNFWLNHLNDVLTNNGGWIDFEKEIELTLEKIEWFFSNFLFSPRSNINDILTPGDGMISYKLIRELSQGSEWENFDPVNFSSVSSDETKMYKKEILIKLREHLDILNSMLRIYLAEFVDRIAVKHICPNIVNINDLYLLSFNYTNTCLKMYGIKDDKAHFIHGNIKKEIVLGISDDAFNNNDYIYFQKYFQRIQKRTGSDYLKWTVPSFNSGLRINLHIFGHSLDKTDKGILEYFLNNNNIKDNLNNIIIYYHNQEAYENQVINLVNMFGKDYVIENTGSGKIVFKELETPIPIIENKMEKQLLTT